MQTQKRWGSTCDWLIGHMPYLTSEYVRLKCSISFHPDEINLSEVTNLVYLTPDRNQSWKNQIFNSLGCKDTVIRKLEFD